MWRQPDNNVEDTIREEIVAINSILSRQIFQISIVENQEKIVAINYEDKSAEKLSGQINIVAPLFRSDPIGGFESDPGCSDTTKV